jgi:CRP/FNR family cyclic AMP-dependent transcriptional regulator
MISPEKLRRFPLFAGIDPVLFKDIAMAGEEVTFDEGEWLFIEGDNADALYLVLGGSLELKIDLNEDGTRRADLSTLVEGSVAGWSALVDPYVYTLSAVATTTVQAVHLDAVKLRQLMDANPLLGYQIMKQLAKVLGERLTNMRIQFVSLIP